MVCGQSCGGLQHVCKALPLGGFWRRTHANVKGSELEVTTVEGWELGFAIDIYTLQEWGGNSTCVKKPRMYPLVLLDLKLQNLSQMAPC